MVNGVLGVLVAAAVTAVAATMVGLGGAVVVGVFVTAAVLFLALPYAYRWRGQGPL